MKRIWQQLNEPFPDRRGPKSDFLSLLGVGAFVSVFLYVIRPFGMDGKADMLLWGSLAYGGVTVLFGWLYDLFGRYVLKIRMDVPSWTLGKWIISALGLLLWIAFGNYLLVNAFVNWNWLTWEVFGRVAYFTIFVGIFPIVFSGLMIQLRAMKANQSISEEIQSHLPPPLPHHPKMIKLSNGGNQTLHVSIDDLRYMEAMQNYVSVYFLAEGQLKKELLRNTLSKLSAQLADSSMVRCHRSYLVNVDVIESVSGNAQGLKLKLTDVADMEIPVSRSYIATLKELLAES